MLLIAFLGSLALSAAQVLTEAIRSPYFSRGECRPSSFPLRRRSFSRGQSLGFTRAMRRRVPLLRTKARNTDRNRIRDCCGRRRIAVLRGDLSRVGGGEPLHEFVRTHRDLAMCICCPSPCRTCSKAARGAIRRHLCRRPRHRRGQKSRSSFSASDWKPARPSSSISSRFRTRIPRSSNGMPGARTASLVGEQVWCRQQKPRMLSLARSRIGWAQFERVLRGCQLQSVSDSNAVEIRAASDKRPPLSFSNQFANGCRLNFWYGSRMPRTNVSSARNSEFGTP